MRISIQLFYRRHMILWLAIVYLLVQSGCASVEHVRLYREARMDFSEAAKFDNTLVFNNIFPEPASLNNLGANSSQFNYNNVEQSYEKWYRVQAELVALNSRSSKELAQDQLLGSSKSLEIISKSRTDLCAQILSAVGKPVSPPQATNPSLQKSPDPLTVSVAQAEDLLSKKDIQLFPRDEYLLRSLRPAIRYDIAYVNSLRAKQSPDKNKLETFAPIIGQMVQAEKELAETAKACPDNVKLHATMSRYVMLHTARGLLQDIEGAKLPLNVKDPDYASNAELQSLSERLHNFRTQATSLQTPENSLVQNIGLLGADPRTTLQRLTLSGLGEIVQDSAPQPSQ